MGGAVLGALKWLRTLKIGWLAIGTRLGFQHAAWACAASPVECAAVAVFAIVVFIIVACVLEVGG
ncbi:MAG TPA: hypothetical protein VMM78_08765, partial [Thermomicrobiales bacterium]|nr:hypothetical protein [Thermomicrobiales bacterium]